MRLRIVQIVFGLACALFFLALALYRVPVELVGAAIATADPIWIGAAICVYAANLALRAWRWKIILHSVAVIPYQTVAKALLVGYGLNTIMPARLGEFFRAEFFKGSYGLSRVWALTSIVIERLFDGLVVVGCLGVGLLVGASGTQVDGVLAKVLVMGGLLFGGILLAAFSLSGSAMSRVFSRFPALSAQLAMVQRGFRILRTWRTVEVAALSLIIYVPDALCLWFIVKAVGLALGPLETLVLVGAASLSTLVPSGPAFLGTLQFAYVLAIEFAGGPRVLGIAAATLAQLYILLPVAIIATVVLAHSSGTLFFSLSSKRHPEDVADAC